MHWIDLPIAKDDVYGPSMKKLISTLKSCDFPYVCNKLTVANVAHVF